MDADFDEADDDSALYQALAGEAAKTEREEEDDVLESIAAELGDLIGGLSDFGATENELIGEGEDN
jgi:DNA-directed RNA polymerase subunit beta